MNNGAYARINNLDTGYSFVNGRPRNPAASFYRREVVMIDDDLVVVHDNLKPTSSANVPTFNWHFAEQPQAQGNRFSLPRTTGEIVMTAVLPDSTARITEVNQRDNSNPPLDVHRVSLTPDAWAPQMQALTVFQIGQRGTVPNLSYDEIANRDDAMLLYAFIKGADRSYVGFVRNEQSISATQYGPVVAGRHVLSGLLSGRYTVLADGVPVVTLDTSANGVLDFTTNAASQIVIQANDGATTIAAPSGLTESEIEARRVTLNWQDNADNETAYEIERRSGNDAFALVSTLGANSQRYVDTSVLPATRYAYRVRAISGQQASNYSPAIDIETPTETSDPVIDAPTSLTATALSANMIRLTWVDNASNEANYLVEQSLDGSSFELVTDLPASSSQYQASQLNASTRYYYRVRARAGNRFSGYSNVTNATTEEETSDRGLNVPTGLAISQITTNQVVLTWQDNSTAETHFEVSRRVGDGPFRWRARLPANSTSYTDNSVLPDTQYAYRVRALDYQVDASDYSEPVATRTPAEDGGEEPPTLNVPVGVVITDVEPTKVTVNWQDNSSGETHFEVSRRVGDGPFRWRARLPANSTSYTDNSVSPDTQYAYRVRALDYQVDASGYSTPAATRTPAGNSAISNAPTRFKAASILSTVMND